MAEYLITPDAEADLAALAAQLENAFGPSVAESKIARIEEVFERLAAHPELGRRRGDLAPVLRGFPVNPNLVLYRIPSSGLVEIARVVDGRCDLPALLSPERASEDEP